jgi:hypothetical protein
VYAFYVDVFKPECGHNQVGTHINCVTVASDSDNTLKEKTSWEEE